MQPVCVPARKPMIWDMLPSSISMLKEKKFIDECGAANFFGIKDNTYITPKSSSILPSITNKSLMQLAEDMGMTVERRPIAEEEAEHLRGSRSLWYSGCN